MMSNPLTGDFEAVVQMSGLTVNRLLASLHQNIYSAKPLPTAPAHTVMRIGDVGFFGAAGGVRGKAWVQLGVPSMELIDGATDEVWMEVRVRARFVADPATAPFPEFIYGRVRAKYRFAATPWTMPTYTVSVSRLTLLRLDVDPDSISFTSFGDPFADPQITEQVRVVMQRQLVVTPQPLLDDFKASRFRSVVQGAETAVCHPLGAGATNPAARIDSLRNLVLGGRDFAVAVSKEYILSQIQPSLDSLKATPTSFWVRFRVFKFKVVSGTYTVTVDTAAAAWSALPPTPISGLSPVGTVTLTIHGTVTSDSILPNASVSVTHSLSVLFDATSETLSVDASAKPSVSADVNGPFGGLVQGRVEQEVTKQYNAALATALAQMGPKLQAMLTRKQDIISQLRTMDDQADAHFDAVESSPDGFILRGPISLSPRHLMWVQVDKLVDGSGYTALASWIPGGHIDEYQWRWYFTTSPISAGMPPDGSAFAEDRFLLQSAAPVPGVPIYDGSGNPPKILWGQLCLIVKGRTINAVTGHEQTVDNVTGSFRERQCMYVVPAPPPPPTTWNEATKPRRRRLWWTLWLAGTGTGAGTADERVAAYVEAARSTAQSFNALVHYVGDEAAAASLTALAEGTRTAGRPDAGLLVTLVLGEGLMGRSGPVLTAALTEFAERLDRPLLITEDVQRGWSTALGARSGVGTATQLIDANGVAAWAGQGPPDPATIAAALRQHLKPCPTPHAEPVQLSVRPGDTAPNFFVETAGQWTELKALRGRPVMMTFVQEWARPCIAQLRRLQRLQTQLDSTGTVALALVQGIDAEGARVFARRYGLTFVISPDPDGAISDRYGVRVWPTTVLINERGQIAGVDMGADAGALAALAREPEWASAAGGQASGRR